VPSLPVMNLVTQHYSNLAQTDIDGLMMSWSVGGFPSPNLELARYFDSKPAPTVRQALTQIGESRYGPDALADVLAAWRSSAPPSRSTLPRRLPLQWSHTVRASESALRQAQRLPRDHGRVPLR